MLVDKNLKILIGVNKRTYQKDKSFFIEYNEAPVIIKKEAEEIIPLHRG